LSFKLLKLKFILEGKMNQYSYKDTKKELIRLLEVQNHDIFKQIPEHKNALNNCINHKRLSAPTNIKRFLNAYMRDIPNRCKKILKLFRIIHKYEIKKNIKIDTNNISKFTFQKQAYNEHVQKRNLDKGTKYAW